MKVTLYMATSIDGFVAKKDGDSDWVSEIDSVNFENQMKEKGCIIVGNRTFEQYQDELYPVEGIANIVLTNDNRKESKFSNVFFVNSPQKAIQKAILLKHTKALLICGGTTNGLFLKENLIDEIILSVHPLILGDGIKFV